jgi:hypothetical protein
VKLKIVIVDLELSTKAKKRLAFGVPLALILASGAIAFAGINWTPPHEWSNDAGANYAGPSLKASDLDDNFNTLADAGATLQAQVDGLQGQITALQVGAATFCGVTSPVDGKIGSYALAQQACASVANCTASAHMCSGDELVRSAQMGNRPGVNGWYSLGAGIAGTTNSPEVPTDCVGWTNNDSTVYGPNWTNQGSYSAPLGAPCDGALAILCCE